jgi:hypothetical protein
MEHTNIGGSVGAVLGIKRAAPIIKRGTMTVEDVAKICHEANRSLCQTHGDFSQTSWDDAPEWQKESAIKGVKFVLENPNSPASASHDSWLKEKLENGWSYGEVKDVDKKLHPCMVPYDQLPKHQQAKDHLFKGVVLSLVRFVDLPVLVTAI